MVEVFKLLILSIVVLFPMWIMAEELDGDEFGKSAAGIAAGAVMLGALKVIESQYSKRNGSNKGKKE